MNRLLKLGISNLLHGQLTRDVGWLYFIHFLNYLLPFFLIPFLTRVLGAEGWGVLAFALSFASFTGFIAEYGFYVSAQREAARYQDDPKALSSLFSEVLCAKLLMSGGVVFMAASGGSYLPVFREDPRLLIGALYLGVTQAFNLTWYFRGTLRFRVAAGMDAAAKGLSVVMTVWLTSSPDDVWKYFLAFGTSQLCVLVWGFWYLSREIDLRIPVLAEGIKALQAGRQIFYLHALGSAFSAGNVFWIGLFAPPRVVGYFAGAEKIARVFASSLEPVRNALFPRFSQMIAHNLPQARGELKRVLSVMLGISFVLGCVLYFMAPLIVQGFLGKELLPAVSSMRLLAFLPVVLVASGCLGYLWIVPRRLERLCVPILLTALVFNILLAYLLVPRMTDLGMSIAVMASELFVILCYTVIFMRDTGASK